MEKKYFLISIDTEGDNLWEWDNTKPITTNNSDYLYRFQSLCDKFGFKPTYLTNFEMALSKKFVKFAKKTLVYGGCEIGMHLHAWNSLPVAELKERNDGVKSEHPYITEYGEKDIEYKIKYLTNLINGTFNINLVTHRAGRWATNEVYARALEKYGYKYDCSFTPGISWESNSGYTNGSKGTDYSHYDNDVRNFYNTSMIEIPLQSYKNKRIKKENIHGLKSLIRNIQYAMKRKQMIQLRPNGHNLNDLLYVVKKNRKAKEDYLMFMLHSSEFMPSGSPNFRTEEDIEKLYKDLEILFEEISKYYVGMTIGEYGDKIAREKR